MMHTLANNYSTRLLSLMKYLQSYAK